MKKKRDKRKFQSKKLKERLKKGQERSKGRQKNVFKEGLDLNMWRPKDGTHIVDIIPYYAGKYDPIVDAGDPTYSYEYWVHTKVGHNDSWYVCPTEMFNKPCPICEHRQKLREDGKDETLWKPLFPKRRNIYNIVCFDRGEEEKGIQVWDVSFHYFEKFIMALSKKPGRGGRADKSIDFADPYNGKSIRFTVEPPKSKDDYPKFIGHAFDDRDYEIEDDILDSAIIIDEAVSISDYDEISEAYWGGEGEPSHDSTKEKKRGKSNKNKYQELLDELEDLDDMDELEDFIDDNDIDVTIKKKDDEDDVKEKIETALNQQYNENDNELPDWDELSSMKMSKLKKFIKKNDIDIDADEAEDAEELAEMIAEELDIDIDE